MASNSGCENGTSINVPSSKRPRVSGSLSGSHDESKEEEEKENGEKQETCNSERTPHSTTITDWKAFDCPSCNGPLVSPVYQCQMGHVVCATCCTKAKTKSVKCYGGCGRQAGTTRCIALEKLLQSVTFHCPNASYGCTETFKNSEVLDHEKTCVYSPCTCPYVNPYNPALKCNYIGMSKSLYTHFSPVHHSIVFSFDCMKSIYWYPRKQTFLQDSSRTTLFIFNFTTNSSGGFARVVCVAPDWSRGAFSYDLTAVIDSKTYVKMKASVECMPKWTADRSLEKCLVLHNDFVKEKKYLWFELIIRKNPKFAG